MDPLTKLGNGVVYFSQAHALRWIEGVKKRPWLLYREILSNAILYRHLVIQDSHLIQNYDLFSLWAKKSQRLSIEALIKERILVVGRRKDRSMFETALDQVKRGVPVLWPKETTQPAESRQYARFLDKCTENERLIIPWDISEMRAHFAKVCKDDIVTNRHLLRLLGLPTEVARRLIGEVERMLNEGQLTAQAIYDLSGWKDPSNTPREFRRYAKQIKVFATWVHNYHFPLLMKIPIALAPDSLAREATDVLLQKEIPNLDVRMKDPMRALELPEYSYGARRLPPLLAQGLKPVLKLRASSQFDKLQEARDQLLRTSRRLHGSGPDESNESRNLLQRELNKSQEKLDKAMINYCAEIWHTYEDDLKGATFNEAVSSGILFRHKQDMTKAWGRDAFAFAIGAPVYEALMYIAELASGLQLIGIPQNLITFARISVPLSVSIQLAWHNYNNFTVTKSAEQLINLIGRE